LPSVDYLAWFSTARQAGCDDGQLVLAVPNDFLAVRIRERFSSELDRCAAAGGIGGVRIVVDPERAGVLEPRADDAPEAGTGHNSAERALALQRERPCGIVTRLLAERGFWSLTPSAQLQLFHVDDLHGTLQTIPSALGTCGLREATVFTGLLTLWGCGDRTDPIVQTSLKHLADVVGMSWSGNTASMLRESIQLLKLTNYYIAVQDGTLGGWDRTFSILDDVQTVWSGPRTSPHRHVTAVFSRAIFEQITSHTNIRPIDLTVLRGLGEQRHLARRLFLLLESLPAHKLDARTHYIHRLVDQRLAGTLGANVELKDLRRKLDRAGTVLMEHDARYQLVDVVPRAKRDLRRGEARYLLRAFRARMAATD